MFKYCLGAFLGTLLVLFGSVALSDHMSSSDKEMKSKAVQLIGAGSCSGEQITAPSGRTYILSAGHCKDLKGSKNSITVKTEDGKILERAIIAEDKDSDLLLLEGIPNVGGLYIAESYEKDEHIRTFTHGAALPTYKTEGAFIGTKAVIIAIGLVDEEHACQEPKYKIIQEPTPLGEVGVCVMVVDEMVTTAMVVPGSSGGMAVNDAGELVGVVSATDGHFGYMVTLRDIQHFISNY